MKEDFFEEIKTSTVFGKLLPTVLTEEVLDRAVQRTRESEG